MHTPRIQGVPDLGPGLRLHLNENTGGCSPAVVEAVRAFDARALATYPDYRAAVVETARFLGVDPEWLVLTNGLDEGVLLTAIGYLGPAASGIAGLKSRAADRQSTDPNRTYTDGARGRSGDVLMAVPAFETYITTAKAMGARIVSVPPGPDYAFPAEAMLAAVTADTRLIFINNPNNPTGQAVTKDAIRRIAREASHALVFLDEAYHDFMGEHFLDEALAYPNVLVGRTFSKAHGLAGMRVGVMIASPQLLEPIRSVMPLFNLNVVAVAALRAALSDRDFMPWSVAQATRSKQMLYDACERVGLRYWKSAANFVLIDGGPDARQLVNGMIARGVLVRDRTSDPFCPNCFRITAGLVAHTEKAVEALEALCARR
jgi:histidinol-phosphate aminotransferase